VDECLNQVVQAILETGGRCIITADHGNCEYMWDYEENVPFTAHTTNPVPCVLVDNERRNAVLRTGGRLSDLAPTMLELMNLPKPAEMTGSSLIKE
jgi:2,3-bisphosphoglycerate-independent phosphoglycerate mutase